MKPTRLRPLLLLLIIVLATIACENDLPFNFPDSRPKLVLNALMSTESTTHTLFLNLTGKDSSGHVEGATVEVRVNGKLTEQARPAPPLYNEDKQCRFRLSSRFAPGDVVRIDATTDAGQHAWVEVSVPQRPKPLTDVDTLTVRMVQSGHSVNYMRYRFRIDDRPGERNYYRLVVERKRTYRYQNEETGEWEDFTSSSTEFISRDDVVLTDGRPTNSDDEENGFFGTVENIYSVFDDSRFQDTSYTMTVYNQPHTSYVQGHFTDYIGFKEHVSIRLLSLTEMEYHYLKALNTFDSEAYDETFNEPIKFPSNVNGGAGFVGISSEVSYIVPIKE